MAAGDAAHAPPAAEAQSLVESFCAVTSATPDEAAFFLEGHNWALESAVRSFYDNTEVDADGPDPAPQPLPPPPPPASADGADSEDEDYAGGGDKDEDDEDYVGGGGDDDDDEDAALAAASAAVDERRRRRPAKRQKRSHQARGGSEGASGRGTVRTLSDLGGGKGRAGSDEDEDSDDDEWAPPPELYTGGERSGMAVRDRSKRKNVADEVFKQAMRKGAKQGPARRQPSSSRSFPGASRILAGETVQPDAPQPPEEIVHDIYFWSNGFTVDDGPLRSFDDPEHASFLESIKNSECPTELALADRRSKVNVNLIRKEEKCPEPVKRPAPFQGGGRTLAAPSENSAPSDITPASAAAAAASTATTTAPKIITVDDSLPSTSLQIRFADGSRVVARFNTSHTISDVRAFIDTTRPGETSDYTLQVGFPPKPLDDVTKTIEEAGVANWVIIQRV
ncbi:plant UBX domain-containing protein 4-like [Hordeum vulgare subsp. vulgare]|uniref:UBX domain-containing protein n=1 Tax=Hordeum vulgare subsp. vulgare TaxID=112509 RepID=A0A8I6YY46_HORVV|nr:plant UBX domain-containing protein 4-like [Hordeum vulgare subsp. vulgare]